LGKVSTHRLPIRSVANAKYRMKTSGEQCDDRIVEVHWDPASDCWRFMRFRDDKPHGNHRSVVQKVIESIRDGVEKEAVRPGGLFNDMIN
jgi:hypothetical protein